MSLMLKIGVDSSAVQTGLARVEGAVGRFGTRMAGALAGVIGAGALTSLAKQGMEMADRLDELGKRFGLSASKLQLLGNVAQAEGTDIESLGQGLKFLAKNAQLAAAAPTGDLARAFAAIGVSGKDLISLKPDELFLRLADAMASGKLSGQEFAVASKLLGRGFEQLLPVLRMSREEIERIGKSKGIFSEKDIAILARMQDFLEKIANLSKVATATIGAGFLDSFKQFLTEAGPSPVASNLKRFFFGDDKAPAARRSGGASIRGAPGVFDENVIEDQRKLETDRLRSQKELQTAEERYADAVRQREMASQDANEKIGRTQAELVALQVEAAGLADNTAAKYEKLAEIEAKRLEIMGLQNDAASEAKRLADEQARAAERLNNIRSDIESIIAQREGPQAEFELLKKRALQSADLARSTGSMEDTLAAERDALALQQETQNLLQRAGLTDEQAFLRARDDTAGLVGKLPSFSPDARKAEVNRDNRPVQEPTVQNIAQKMEQTIDKLDELIRKTDGGVFTF